TTGAETIKWHHVIEEILADTSGAMSDPNAGPFSVASTIPQPELRGLVALRINYPFQATTLSAYQPHQDDAPLINTPVLADDSHVSETNTAPGTAVPYTDDLGVYSGQFGLGTLHALGEPVRPFNRLLVAQSIFRREVFK